MSRHANAGKLYKLDDTALRKLADGAQAEWQEMCTRYGMQAFFAVGGMRQEDAGGEDVELSASIYGCSHCLPFFLARAVMADVHLAQIFADTLRWIEKLREEPDATITDLESMPVVGSKAN